MCVVLFGTFETKINLKKFFALSKRRKNKINKFIQFIAYSQAIFVEMPYFRFNYHFFMWKFRLLQFLHIGSVFWVFYSIHVSQSSFRSFFEWIEKKVLFRSTISSIPRIGLKLFRVFNTWNVSRWKMRK